ncbi:hypothetical protein [Streptomyces sp. NWU49]|uniref:hypothetical protein n=1 Tax=Streptomyces sp. NWU49 TaxID=2201153 RepID=UPI0015E80D20|nr:hypothetical protein [Streptomyces sp. NWU49]
MRRLACSITANTYNRAPDKVTVAKKSRAGATGRTTCNSCGISRSRTSSAVAFAAVVTSPAARSSIRTRPTQGAACSRSKSSRADRSTARASPRRRTSAR